MLGVQVSTHHRTGTSGRSTGTVSASRRSLLSDANVIPLLLRLGILPAPVEKQRWYVERSRHVVEHLAEARVLHRQHVEARLEGPPERRELLHVGAEDEVRHGGTAEEDGDEDDEIVP